MPPNKIPEKDWNKVHSLAVDLVNSNVVRHEKILLEKLKVLLVKLSIKYGSNPNILGVWADFEDDQLVKELLYHLAYKEAKKLKDFKNCVLLSSSLTEFYHSKKNQAEFKKWCLILRQVLKYYPDSYEEENLRKWCQKK
jgi:hypothetical protein